MIAPLTPFPIRGVIWYQGESNSPLERAPLYGRIFRTLIEDWRSNGAKAIFPSSLPKSPTSPRVRTRIGL